MNSPLIRLILTRLDPRAAPIISRMVNFTARPSPGMTLTYGAGLFIVSGVLWAAYYRHEYYLYAHTLGLWQIGLLWSAIGASVLIAIPIPFAMLAARLASKEARSEQFRLLGLTHLTGRAVYQGYFFAVVYRKRFMLAFLLGLLPVWVGSLSALSLWTRAPVPVWDWLVRIVFFSGAGIGLWGMNLVAAALGTGAGLRLRSESAIPAAGLGMSFILVTAGMFTLSMLGPLTSVPIDSLSTGGIAALISGAVVLAAGPFIWLRGLLTAQRPVLYRADLLTS